MKILCGGPISEDAPVFEAYIEALKSQGFELDFKGIDGSPTPLTPPTGFRSVAWRYGTNSGEYKEKRVRWTYSRLGRMQELRNEMRHAAIEGDYDYLFMVDSDMICAPDTLTKLLDVDEWIVAGLTWTKQKPHWQRCWPNAWGLDNTRPDFPPHVPPDSYLLEKIKRGGVHEVEVTGGCYLISRYALKKVNFGPWAGVISEDVCFALSAREAGIPIFLNCDVQIEHRRRR